MTDAQILAVLDRYETHLRELLKGQSTNAQEELFHCLGMIPQIRRHLELGRRGKAFRWLGFIQGVFYSHGEYSIEQMKEHNRG